MAGEELERFRIGAERRLERAESMQEIGAIEMGVEKIRLDAQRLFDKFERAFELASLAEHNCAGAKSLGIGRLQP